MRGLAMIWLLLPSAFVSSCPLRLLAAANMDLERAVRMECRQVFHNAKLMERILPDIAEVLDAADDLGETAEEMEGRAVSLADRAEAVPIRGQSPPKNPGPPWRRRAELGGNGSHAWP